MLGQGLLGMLGQGSWEASGQSLGDVLGAFFDVLGVSWRGPGEARRGSGEASETSWESLGALREAWSAKGGHPAAYGALSEASCSSPGQSKTPPGRPKAGQRSLKRRFWWIFGRILEDSGMFFGS